MSDLFKLVAEKQLEGTGIQIAEKINPLLGAIGVAGALTAGHLATNPNSQKADQITQAIQKTESNHRMGKIVKAEVDYKNYSITYYDAEGNMLIKKGGDINKLANNPGNIALPRKGFGPNNKQKFKDMGAVGYFKGRSNVYAIFPTEEAGIEALEKWFNEPSRQHMNVRTAMHIYAPKIENNTENYIKFIKSHGIKETDTLGDLSQSKKNDLINAIQKMEGKREPSVRFVPKGQLLASNNVQKVSINESKNINTKKAPLYIAKSIDDICLTMKQHKLNTVKVSYDSSIDTYIFGDTYNYVHWSLISTAMKNGLYLNLEDDIDAICYTNDLDNFAISTSSHAKDLIEDKLEPIETIESYGITYYIYRNNEKGEFKSLNEATGIPTYEEDGTRYFYGYYCFTESELLNMLDTKFSRNDVRVAYEFNKHVYMFSDTITTIHYNIVFLAATETNLFDSIPEIKENKNADEDTVQELIKQYLYIAPFKIYRNDSQDSDEMFLKFLFNTVDNTSDYYDMACKINETKWAVCRSDEFGDVKQVPLLQGKKWITAEEYFSKYEQEDEDEDFEELNESVSGNKVIAYHGSQNDKLQFATDHTFYLTDNYDLAYEFATKDGDGGLIDGEVATIYTCELNIKKAYETHSEEEYDSMFLDVNINRAHWLSKGYNAIIVHPTEGSPTTYYIMLNPQRDVKIIKKEVIDSDDLLLEGFLKSKTPISQLVNIIAQNLIAEEHFKLREDSSGKNISNKQIKDSYYIIVTAEDNNYGNIKFPVSLKFRCSTHIKEHNRSDCDVFVPNEDIFKNYLKNDKFNYILTNNTINEYAKQGIADIKNKITNYRNKIISDLKKIDSDYESNYRNLNYTEKYLRYEKIINKDWFKKFIENKEQQYLKNHAEEQKPVKTSHTLTLSNIKNPT